jgi:hypothetical protein
MVEILIPFKIEGLLLKPEMAGRFRISEEIQQTLASLIGYDGVSRRLLKCSQGGILQVASPRIKDIFHVTAVGDNYTYQSGDIPATEVMIMGHPDNDNLVWVKNDEVATTNNGWPLAKKEVLAVSVENLNNLHLLIASDGEKAIIAYTR